MTGAAAVPAGVAGAVLGSAAAPDGQGLERALATGGGLAAAVLGARGGSKLLAHLASKQGLSRSGMNIPYQGLIGGGAGAAAAGLGASEGIKGISNYISS
jgi:hypothetical protein